MKILLLGSGGREHSIAWKLIQSPHCEKLFIAPGNAGTKMLGENVPINSSDFQSIKNTVIENMIDMIVVGPEDYLVAGIHDYFLEDIILQNIPVIGPKKDGAMLEGSKEFAKKFMINNKIPTAAYQSFTIENMVEGLQYIKQQKLPIVLKADGLAAGKGVVISNTYEDAERELIEMLQGTKFGKASSKVVIEEYLHGIEISIFVLTDGINYKILPTAKDYKRIDDGDNGLNTGGMGAVSPVPFADEVFIKKVEERIIIPTIDGLKKDGIDYKGFIFIGLMNVEGNPYVIEYNVRLGDPETEVVVPRIKSDLVELFTAVANRKLDEFELQIEEKAAATVMLVSGGYPGTYKTGFPISGIDNINESLVFHAGTTTSKETGEVVTSGGRVLAITSFGENIKEAVSKSYESIKKIEFLGMHYRKDIGKDLFNG